MSRLIVKNIPNNISESQLKKIFEAKGEVTDVKIIFKGNKNRRFCFIGYKKIDDAQIAQKYFNNTFVHMSKISVNFAKTLDDPQLPKSWSKHSKQQENVEIQQQEPQIKKKNKTQEQSQKFQEFLEIMSSNKNIKEQSWNDNVKRDTEQIIEEQLNKQRKDSQQIVDQIFDQVPQTKLKSKPDSKRLYVTNIPYTSTEEDLRQVFEKYGTIVSLKIPKSRGGSLSGYCFVQYALPEEAIRAFSEMNNKIILGRIFHVQPAYEDDKQDQQEPNIIINQEKSSYKKYKKQQMLERLNDSKQWNTLFLNPNTILDAITQKYGIDKKDILDEENQDIAVKQAQMETQIIKETKDWLKSLGLNIDFLKMEKSQCERSKKVIFVKNLQTRIIEEDLIELFQRYGKVRKVYLAPNKSIGIICFEEEDHAQNAFRVLSNYKFKGALLYLEWAPISLIKEEKKEEVQNQIIEEDESLSRILYVKNLNFKTTQQSLYKLFQQKFQDLKSVTIIKKDDKSQGYGFIEFSSSESAKKALRMNFTLDDHQLQITQSQPKQNRNKENKQKIEIESNNKLLIKNLPFEATADELRKLIKQYGELKKLRLPKKLDGQLKGFAFAEFVNIEEAENVMDNLSNTHFYGRKLVIEYAKEE